MHPALSIYEFVRGESYTQREIREAPLTVNTQNTHRVHKQPTNQTTNYTTQQKHKLLKQTKEQQVDESSLLSLNSMASCRTWTRAGWSGTLTIHHHYHHNTTALHHTASISPAFHSARGPYPPWGFQTRHCAAFGKHWKKQPPAPSKKPKGRPGNQTAHAPTRPTPRVSGRARQARLRKPRTPFGIPEASDAVHPNTTSASSTSTTPKTGVPPMFAWPTASPYVFVTRTAVVTAGVDHTQLFREAAEPSYDQPSLFHNGRFEYLSSVSDGSSKKPLQLPPDSDVPEVAFLGRSNVGKSSLINALMRRDLARISKQPGRTQQVHLFGIVPRAYEPPPAHHHGAAAPDYAAAARGVFVDLPGYGFAVGPDDAVESWQVLTQRFLRTRRRDTGNLRRLFLLVDARHGTQTIDHFVMTWLEDNDIPYTVVLTKADCVGAPQIVRMVNQICLRYAAEVGHAADGDVAPAALYMSPIVHVTSAKGGRGLAELLSTIENEFLVRNDTDEDEEFSDDEDSSVDGDSSDEDDDDDDDDEDSSDDDDSQYNGDSSDDDSDDDKRPDGSVRPRQR